MAKRPAGAQIRTIKTGRTFYPCWATGHPLDSTAGYLA